VHFWPDCAGVVLVLVEKGVDGVTEAGEKAAILLQD
jgi:hypothetical protein